MQNYVWKSTWCSKSRRKPRRYECLVDTSLPYVLTLKPCFSSLCNLGILYIFFQAINNTTKKMFVTKIQISNQEVREEILQISQRFN